MLRRRHLVKLVLSWLSIAMIVLLLFKWNKNFQTETKYDFPEDIAPSLVSNDSIQRIIHQSWKVSTLPERFLRWSKTWHGPKGCLSNWNYKMWTDSDNRNFIAQHYSWFLRTYDSFPEPIYRADSMRYFYMYHYGGLYVDLDFECLRPFEHLLVSHNIVLAAMEGNCAYDQYRQYRLDIKEGCIQNAFLFSRKPKHHFWMFLIFDIVRQVFQLDLELRTGPSFFQNMLELYRSAYPLSHEDIKIYPPKYFCPFSYMSDGGGEGCKDLNRMSDEDTRKCGEYYRKKGSYAIEYHTQSHGVGDNSNLRVPIA